MVSCNQRSQNDHVVISLSMSANRIIACPERENLLALEFLDFEIISLALNIMFPDHFTSIINYRDRRIWYLITSRRQKDEVVILTFW